MAPPTSPLIRVDLYGPLEQRAGYHDPCGGWSDGHDAAADRLCAAFAEGDVLLVADGPGGAAAGIQQNLGRALKAKAAYGRRCTGFLNEQAASAHAYWMLSICDEAFSPAAGQIGSIGARADHLDISGMMEKEGLKKTYFVDPPDKIALAPEFPLSAVGAARGNRDVQIVADAFYAAVCAGPIGQRYGLTPEALIALGADMLTGEMAVGIFLDGVESFDAVVEHALALAEDPEARAILATAETAQIGARRTKGSAMRLEEKEPGEGGKQPDGICKSCGVGNPIEHKFCKECGESMEAAPLPPKEEDELPPPSSKPKPAEGGKPAARTQAPAKMDASASLASILGAEGTSGLALNTAAVKLRQIRDTAAGVTGQTDAGKIVGGLLTMPERLENAERVSAAAKRDARAAEHRQRRDLASRLNKLALDAWPPTAIYDEKIDDATGKAVSPRPLAKTIARWDLAEFQGYVEGFEKKAAKPRTPFADRAGAEAGAREHVEREGVSDKVQLGADGEPSPAQIALAKANRSVISQVKAMQERGNATANLLDIVARQHVKTCASLGLSIGGT